MTKSDPSKAGLYVLMGLLSMFCGCDKGPTLSEIEERERSSRLYTNAMDDLQAGRMDAAITGFQRVVLQEPKSYSAHFQLATLLQDVRKDYISAIAHYRNYLALRPASDKATVAQDRVKSCESLLSAEIVRKAGGSASNKLSADNERLTGECEALTAQVKKLETELAKAQKEIARLEGENASKKRLLEKLSSEDDVNAPRSTNVKDALAELKADKDEAERRRLRPTDAELLDEDDTPQPGDRIRNSVDIRKLKGEIAKIEAEPPPPVSASSASVQPQSSASGSKTMRGKPTRPAAFDALLGGQPKTKNAASARPETYVVQDGDTLFKISTRFYGSPSRWHAIQENNRAIIPADGRLRAGQVIRLP